VVQRCSLGGYGRVQEGHRLGACVDVGKCIVWGFCREGGDGEGACPREG
jgi:hypothetical protein